MVASPRAKGMAIMFLGWTQMVSEKKNHHNEPNDGKDGGVPGDARELLCLAHQLHTERKKYSDKIREEKKELKET